MEHPKYTLLYDSKHYPNGAFVLMEHMTVEGGLLSKDIKSFEHFEDAVRELGYVSPGRIVLAYSEEIATNSVRL